MTLIDSLIKDGWLKTPRIIEAFTKIQRVDFLPEEIKNLAELNEALPIGFGQTISQPLVVAFMFELLGPKPGEKILDIGSGSGWTSALLAELVGEKGRVIAIEVVRELKGFGEINAKKYNFIEQGRLKFVYGDGSKGYQREAPFDKILASASAEKIPRAWKEQIKIGGKIVTPIGSSIWLFNRKSEQEFEEIEYPGFVFVPLVIKEK
jgi:protein-L-isoaspartate(D-aspartate) O-methyltransferase